MSKGKIDVENLEFIGEGAESRVYKLDPTTALKLYMDPDDKDFVGDPDEAGEKLKVMQEKLFEFPKNLPKRVLAPQKLFVDKSGEIRGYTMNYIDRAKKLRFYGGNTSRKQKHVVNGVILPVYRDLHHTVSEIHEADVVIGDFNDTNVLIKDKAAYIIDADSFQFRSPSRFYPGVMLKDDFTDPFLYDKSSPDLKLTKGAMASTDTDWYAYNAMLMQSLLLVKPYGGKYSPNVKIGATERVRRGFTIFNRDVDLPDWAIHPNMLPDDLLQHLYEVFVKGKRGRFPAYLLDMVWTTCTSCGAQHARTRCPNCYRTTNQRKSSSQGWIKSSQTVTSGSAHTGVSASSASLPRAKKSKAIIKAIIKEILDPFHLFR